MPNSNFNLFNALLGQEDVLMYFTTQHLEPQDLYTLFCLSKPFNRIVNQTITSYILSSARCWARLTPSRPSHDVEAAVRHNEQPTAAIRLMRACGTEPTPVGMYSRYDITTQLPFHNYRHLCKRDPALRSVRKVSQFVPMRQKTKPATLLTSGPKPVDVSEEPSASAVPSSSTLFPTESKRIRDVPTFGYLRLVLNRARTIQLIIRHLAKQGHRLPPLDTPAILAKISLTLDIPTNEQRVALFCNQQYWTENDLYIAQLFLIKLDMCFTDPVDGYGERTLSELLLSQRGIEAIEAALAKRDCRTMLETLRMYVRTWHRPSPEHAHFPILGIPPSEIGKTGYEWWGREPSTVPQFGLARDAAGSYSSGAASQQSRSKADGKSLGEPQQAVLTDEPAAASATPSGSTTAHVEPASGQTQQQRGRQLLFRPDELLMAEATRRLIPMQEYLLDMMAYGYIDPNTLEDLPDVVDETEEEETQNCQAQSKRKASADAATAAADVDEDGNGDGDGHGGGASEGGAQPSMDDDESDGTIDDPSDEDDMDEADDEAETNEEGDGNGMDEEYDNDGVDTLDTQDPMDTS